MKQICLLLVLLSSALCEERCCPDVGCFSDDPPYDHLPVPQCQDAVKPNFNLFTRQNRDTAQIMTRTTIPPLFDSGRSMTYFLIHGFQNDRNTEWVVDAKNELLTKGDYNVVIVGWGEGASNLWYPQAAADTRLTGAETAVVIENLKNNAGLDRSQIHCIGHSLGGHTCGHVGGRTGMARATGLDPAGPLFENYPTEAGINPNTADFVDIIHTAGRDGFPVDYGTLKALGDADFYPNGGGIQPGCETKKNDPELYIACSHGRAHVYLRESINSGCQFNARDRCTNERDIPGSCTPCGGVCATMGLDAQSSQRGKFYLTTGSSSPFCEG